MRILGLIPARGGSKGVPRKNIKLLAGRPLLYYTAAPALECSELTKVILSTDDPEIAEVGSALGLEVPFLRPAELAQDTTPTLPVVQHALQFLLEKGESYDAVCLLQPTNPLRSKETISGCIRKLKEEKLDSVFTTLRIPHEYNPYWAYLQKKDGMLALSTGGVEPIPRRQALPEAYYREGSVYVTRTEVILHKNSLYGEKVGGYLLSQPQAINIDTLEDWAKAEHYFNEQSVCAE